MFSDHRARKKFARLGLFGERTEIRSYTNAPRTWTPGELVTASMMNTLRDLFLEIEAGTASFTKATFTGKTTSELTSLLSGATKAALAFDTDKNKIVVSIEGGAYAPIISGTARQTFRNLFLQTHPDADVMASKVYLDHADEIVMDDGESVLTWDDLTADVTASGAGGLDTGSEGSTRWYEIYAIRKTSDGTKNLLLHRAKNFGVDQGFTTTPDTQRYLRLSTGTATDKIAQSFQVTTAGLVQFIDVKLIRTASAPTGQVWFTIEADSSGNPSGTPLATSDKLDCAQFQANGVIYRMMFRTPPTLSASTTYHLVMQGNYTKSDTINIGWQGLVAGGYANGSSKDFNGTTWSATAGANGLDRYFQAYTTQNDSAVTMPSGYDQKCLVGHVYNDGSSNFREFLQINKNVTLRINTDIFANAFTSTTPVLTDASPFVPPLPVIANRFWYTNTAGAGIGFHGGVGARVGGGGGSPWQLGAIWYNAFSTAISDLDTPVPVDTQALYVIVGGGSGNFYMGGYLW